MSSGAGDDQCVRVDTPSGPLCPPGCVLVEPYKSRYEGRLIEVRRSIVQGSIDRQKPIEMRKTSISPRVVSYNKLIVDSGEVCPQTLKRCSNLNTDTDSFVFDLDARVGVAYSGSLEATNQSYDALRKNCRCREQLCSHCRRAVLQLHHGNLSKRRACQAGRGPRWVQDGWPC